MASQSGSERLRRKRTTCAAIVSRKINRLDSYDLCDSPVDSKLWDPPSYSLVHSSLIQCVPNQGALNLVSIELFTPTSLFPHRRRRRRRCGLRRHFPGLLTAMDAWLESLQRDNTRQYPIRGDGIFGRPLSTF